MLRCLLDWILSPGHVRCGSASGVCLTQGTKSVSLESKYLRALRTLHNDVCIFSNAIRLIFTLFPDFMGIKSVSDLLTVSSCCHSEKLLVNFQQAANLVKVAAVLRNHGKRRQLVGIGWFGYSNNTCDMKNTQSRREEIQFRPSGNPKELSILRPKFLSNEYHISTFFLFCC
jgi:hypothetical protein